MTTEHYPSVAERLSILLQQLGIERAHFVASALGDAVGFARARPEAIASLSFACPPRMTPAPLREFASRLLVIAGDQGPPAVVARHVVASLPGATLALLRDYFSPPWADAAADRTEEIGSALLDFLGRIDQWRGAAFSPHVQESGTAAGITYRIRGSGPPLILFPLSLASSQWEPLLPKLSEHYCTIALGGPELCAMAFLESRGRSPGYLALVRCMVEDAELRPGELVLDVGSGSGAIDRWLARHTQKANRIIGIDINRYLLREAADLVNKERLDDVIEFREGNAESLPLPDDYSDVTLSCTLLEEGEADRMLAEMVRVTKPGGRVGAMVRGLDVPWVVNVSVPPALKAKGQTPTGYVGPRGCADSSLYQRLRVAGLTEVKMSPRFAVYVQPHSPNAQFWQAGILSALDAEEAQEWRAAVDRAEVEGTFFIAQSHHCAVGTKPLHGGTCCPWNWSLKTLWPFNVVDHLHRRRKEVSGHAERTTGVDGARGHPTHGKRLHMSRGRLAGSARIHGLGPVTLSVAYRGIRGSDQNRKGDMWDPLWSNGLLGLCPWHGCHSNTRGSG